jgi:hypothetical protein
MNFVRGLFATPAKTPPKLEADFYKYDNGLWNAVGNESAVVSFIADSFSIELDDDDIHLTFPVRKLSQPKRTIDDEGGVNIQWIERKNDSVAEYGLRFTDREMADEFWRKFSRCAQEESEALAQAEIDLLVYNGKDWAKVEDLEDVFALASQRSDFEAYLTFSDVEQTRVVLNLPVNHQLNMGKNDNDTCLSFACTEGVYMMRFRSRSDYAKFCTVIDRMLAERAARTRVDLDVVMQSLDPEDGEDEEEEEVDLRLRQHFGLFLRRAAELPPEFFGHLAVREAQPVLRHTVVLPLDPLNVHIALVIDRAQRLRNLANGECHVNVLIVELDGKRISVKTHHSRLVPNCNPIAVLVLEEISQELVRLLRWRCKQVANEIHGVRGS